MVGRDDLRAVVTDVEDGRVITLHGEGIHLVGRRAVEGHGIDLDRTGSGVCIRDCGAVAADDGRSPIVGTLVGKSGPLVVHHRAHNR